MKIRLAAESYKTEELSMLEVYSHPNLWKDVCNLLL